MYIKPPRGDIQLVELTECVTTRLQYFIHRYQSQEIEEKAALKFEYLTLGSALDRVGHFTLRLLAAISEELREFIASSEASFIVERLEFSTPRQIIQFLNTTLRHLEEEASSPAFESGVWRREVFDIFSIMKCAFKCSHMNGFTHDVTCSQYVFKVPFHMCLKMVAKRELLLEKGSVLVPCGKWKSFLNCFLEAFFVKEIFKMRSSQVVKESVTDERLDELKNVVLNLFKSSYSGSSSKESVSSEEMKDLQKLFPPCMANLYNNLKTNHRLSHYARFNFSLFLKDIGMSLNESIEFWRNEYSKPGKCGSKCLHSWQKDSAKYTYSIRHLYGLEGKRANYVAPSCTKIQSNNLGPIDEGGCPFLTFDANKLQKCLDPKIVQNKEQVEMIMHLKSNDHIKACDYYRKTLLKAAQVEYSSIRGVHKSPVEYFNMLREDLLESYNKG